MRLTGQHREQAGIGRRGYVSGQMFLQLRADDGGRSVGVLLTIPEDEEATLTARVAEDDDLLTTSPSYG